jgi:protein-histidine pros-kinase
MAALALVFVIIFVLLNLLLSFSVIRPVKRLTAVASEVSLGNLEAPEMEAKGSGEIASLTASFNRMRRSLENAMRMIG